MNKDFYESVKENIIAYMPEEFRWHNVRIDEVNKTGDVKLHGLSLTKGNSGTAPILYLEPFAQMIEDGAPEEQILKGIAKKYTEIVRAVPKLLVPDMSFESLKENLRVRLVYSRTNTDYLRDHICVNAGNEYSLVVYADLSETLFDGAIINMRKDMLEKFGLDEQAVIDAAIEGSVKNCPARLTHIEAELFAQQIGQEPEDLFTMDGLDHPYDGVLVLSTLDRFAGAAALYYPGVKERIAELVQAGYYVLPSSVHEVLVIPDSGDKDPNELAMMVSMVNANEVSLEEQLGNRVLFYDDKEKCLNVACDLDKDKNREEAR